MIKPSNIYDSVSNHRVLTMYERVQQSTHVFLMHNCIISFEVPNLCSYGFSSLCIMQQTCRWDGLLTITAVHQCPGRGRVPTRTTPMAQAGKGERFVRLEAIDTLSRARRCGSSMAGGARVRYRARGTRPKVCMYRMGMLRSLLSSRLRWPTINCLTQL